MQDWVKATAVAVATLIGIIGVVLLAALVPIFTLIIFTLFLLGVLTLAAKEMFWPE